MRLVELMLWATLMVPAWGAANGIASAKSNVDLWRERPQEAQAYDTHVLAAAQGALFGLELDPGLHLGRFNGTSSFSYQGALFGYGFKLLEKPRWGLSVRVDRLALEGFSQNLDDPNTGLPNVHLGRMAVEQAEAEARLYPLASMPQAFVGGTLGTYAPAVTFERVRGRSRTIAAWPVSAAVGVGWGRVLPITPRVAVAHLERTLLAEGLIDEPLSQALANELVAYWAAHVNDLGHYHQAVEPLRALWAAQALRAPLSPLVAYRVERIVEAWLTQNMMPRWRGSQAWLLVRGSHSALERRASAWGLTIEFRAKSVRHLSVESQLFIEPNLGWAPRVSDRQVNVLPGMRRANPLGMSPIPNLMSAQSVRFEAPVRYERLFFDPFDNQSGLLTLEALVALGAAPRIETSAGAAGAYTYFRSSTQGLKVALVASGARTQDGPRSELQVTLAYVQGSGAGKYVAPTALPSMSVPETGGQAP